MFILRRLHENYHANRKKLYKGFVGLEIVLDRAPKKVLEWAMGKKGIPEDLAR